MQQTVKVIGTNGQLSLGKDLAGKMVLIEKVDDSTWLIKAGEFIPESEKWLHQPETQKKLERALAWTQTHAPQDNFKKVIRKLENG